MAASSCRPAWSSTSTSMTEKSDSIPTGLPTLRDPDNELLSQARAGRAWRSAAGKRARRTFGAAGCPSISAASCSSRTWTASKLFVLPAAERLPVLNEVGIRTVINGPIPVSADGEPIMGLAPELDNFFVACGFTAGIAASGGAGLAMANWIVDGEPGMDLWPFDVRRFGSRTRARAISRAPRRGLRALLQDPLAGRGADRARRPALAAACAARGRRGVRLELRLGAAELVRPAGSERDRRASFEGRPNWFDPVGGEHAPSRARRADRPEVVLQIRDRGPRRLRRPAADRRQRPRQAAGRAASTPSSATSAAASRPISPSRGSTRTASTW